MDKPLISVIVPVYQAELYLESCVHSILNQTYSEIEVLLIDDGSSDGSGAMCDALAAEDPRVQVFHQANAGVSAARNAGIDNAKGTYLMFVDSDDELLPNAIEFLYADVVRFCADIVSAVKCTVREDGTVLNPYENGLVSVYSGLEPLVLSLDGERQTNSVCAKLFSRSFLKTVRFAEGRNINEDGYFLFQCYLQQPVLVQHNVSIYRYFVRDCSNSRSAFSEKYLDMLYFAQEKKKQIAAQYPQLMDKVINMEVSTHLFFLEALCRDGAEAYCKERRASIRLVRRHAQQYAPLYAHERQMARIVRFGLYPLYRFGIRLRRRMK